MPRSRALLLNASFEPHSIIDDRDAITLRLDGDVEVIENSEYAFHSPSITIQVPSVIRLVRYVVMPAKHRSVMLTTRNVLARDKYVCGYCLGVAQTTDHIVPRAKGGLHVWENVVAACRKCNHTKGNKLLSQLGWTLHITPTRPHGVAAHLLSMKPQPEWAPYLQVV